MIGLAHVVGCTLGDNTRVGGNYKALSLILNAESHTLDVVTGLKGGNLHIQHAEGDFLENGHMAVGDASRDAATLQQLAHHPHSAIDAALAAAHGRVETAHVVLVGMG